MCFFKTNFYQFVSFCSKTWFSEVISAILLLCSSCSTILNDISPMYSFHSSYLCLMFLFILKSVVHLKFYQDGSLEVCIQITCLFDSNQDTTSSLCFYIIFKFYCAMDNCQCLITQIKPTVPSHGQTIRVINIHYLHDSYSFLCHLNWIKRNTFCSSNRNGDKIMSFI